MKLLTGEEVAGREVAKSRKCGQCDKPSAKVVRNLLTYVLCVVMCVCVPAVIIICSVGVFIIVLLKFLWIGSLENFGTMQQQGCSEAMNVGLSFIWSVHMVSL